jgi:hypothetical protein
LGQTNPFFAFFLPLSHPLLTITTGCFVFLAINCRGALILPFGPGGGLGRSLVGAPIPDVAASDVRQGGQVTVFDCRVPFSDKY